MRKLESILVSVDRNGTARCAVEKAVAMARHYGARIELFLCDAERAYELKREYDARGVEQARKHGAEQCFAELEKLRASVDTAGLQVTLDASCESPLYEGIVRKVLKSHPDLVLRCVGSAEARQSGTLSETDWELVRTCPAPLMLTRGKPWAQPPRIGAAVDVSPEESPGLAGIVLQTAALLKAGCGGRLEVLHGAGGHDDAGAMTESRLAALRDRVAESALRADDIHVVTGQPGRALPEFAGSRGYDVIVLGALTHRAALTALVGTFTGRLIDALDCDFVLVKPPGYVCPIGAATPG